MSEVPLYLSAGGKVGLRILSGCLRIAAGGPRIEGYLAHKKPPPFLAPP